MEPVNNERLFNERIDARLKSAEWDLGMARTVLGRRRRKRYILGISGSVGSMAAAALVALLVTAAPEGTPYGEELHSLVNAQVQGTWNQVFADRRVVDGGRAIFEETQFDTTVDTMIDETLAQRL
jgi:hypothetical protein